MVSAVPPDDRRHDAQCEVCRLDGCAGSMAWGRPVVLCAGCSRTLMAKVSDHPVAADKAVRWRAAMLDSERYARQQGVPARIDMSHNFAHDEAKCEDEVWRFILAILADMKAPAP